MIEKVIGGNFHRVFKEIWTRLTMPRYVAFLRAVNVGGRIVKMDALRGHFAAAGFANVETFIASGNVVFDTKAKPGPALEARIEGALKKALGYDVPTFVRSLADVVTAAERTLFPEKDVAAAGALLVGLLKPPVDPAAQKRLNALDPVAAHASRSSAASSTGCAR